MILAGSTFALHVIYADIYTIHIYVGLEFLKYTGHDVQGGNPEPVGGGSPEPGFYEHTDTNKN